MNAMNFIDRKNKTIPLPLRDKQTLGLFAYRPVRRCIFQAEQAAQRGTNQQFAADIYEAGDDAEASVREGMDRPPLGDFLKCLRGQRQPFGVNPEDHGRSLGRAGGNFLFREMKGPFAPVLGRHGAIEQTPSGSGIDGAIPAMDELAQFLALAAAVNANGLPAGLNLRQVGTLIRASSLAPGCKLGCFGFVHVTPETLLRNRSARLLNVRARTRLPSRSASRAICRSVS